MESGRVGASLEQRTVNMNLKSISLHARHSTPAKGQKDRLPMYVMVYMINLSSKARLCVLGIVWTEGRRVERGDMHTMWIMRATALPGYLASVLRGLRSKKLAPAA